jgi:hypothetical protein
LGHCLFDCPFDIDAAELGTGISDVEVQNDYIVCVRNNILQHFPVFRMLTGDKVVLAVPCGDTAGEPVSRTT